MPDLFFAGNQCPWKRSKELDKYFGYKISRIEQKLTKKYRAFNKPVDNSNRKKHFSGSQVWIGLHPQTLQTPYSDVYWALCQLQSYKPNSLVDLGAGYGRVGLVSSMVNPAVSFIGIEILRERCAEASRIFTKYGLANCKMINRSLVDPDFEIPQADVYFIYDFSHIDEISYALEKICTHNESKSFFFVVASGEQVSFLIGKGVSFGRKWQVIGSRRDIHMFCVTKSNGQGYER